MPVLPTQHIIIQLYARLSKRREYKYEGTVESVLLIDEMTTEVIAIVYICPTILRLVYKLKRCQQNCTCDCSTPLCCL